MSAVAPIPRDFLCPILHEVMGDSVVTDDGQSYERSAIEQWFARPREEDPDTGMQRPPRSPVTNLPLPSTVLRENVALRNAIRSFLEQRPELTPKPARMRLADVKVAVEAFEEAFAAKRQGHERRLQALEAELAQTKAALESMQRSGSPGVGRPSPGAGSERVVGTEASGSGGLAGIPAAMDPWPLLRDEISGDRTALGRELDAAPSAFAAMRLIRSAHFVQQDFRERPWWPEHLTFLLLPHVLESYRNGRRVLLGTRAADQTFDSICRLPEHGRRFGNAHSFELSVSDRLKILHALMHQDPERPDSNGRDGWQIGLTLRPWDVTQPAGLMVTAFVSPLCRCPMKWDTAGQLWVRTGRHADT